ncbi:MAG: DEAD/DEAH box helicase [Planctomycetes bacterium]|nr:DEAD/DEAH box helicase [Planctomycetota bacterium]
MPFSERVQQDIAAAGYETPTPIQAECIPLALSGRDVIGLAQTGTGKTAAFALPIIERMAHRVELGALVLAPTRELAQQIHGVFEALGRSSGIRAAIVVGGVPMDEDYKALRSWPNVLVATPGRLIDHLNSRSVVLDEIETFVVDEADRMHDMGFIPQIRRIIEALPSERQTLMFTATMPDDVERIARRHMRQPERVQVGRTAPVERAVQQLFAVGEREKTRLLLDLLRGTDGRVLVFVRTKRGVDRLARAVSGRHRRVARLHSDRAQPERDEAMAGFREGRYRILIATDIAARGIDVADIEHVINYDFPRSAEDYLHRIGRTARLAASGRATSFVTRAERGTLASLERLVGTKLALLTANA